MSKKLLALCLLSVGLMGCPSSGGGRNAPLLDGRIVGGWDAPSIVQPGAPTVPAMTVHLNPDGTGTTTTAQSKGSDKSVETGRATFEWSTVGESLTIRKLAGSPVPWPPKDGVYQYSHQAKDRPSIATLTIERVVEGRTGDPAPTELPGLWEFQRP